MNIYFSYSTKVSSKNEDLNLTKKIAQISVEMFKKFYKNVYLITDEKGLKIFEDIGFKKIYSILDIVPEEYKDVWSIGKLYAFRYIAKKNEQFCHVDFDFIITKELPHRILTAQVFVQSIENDLDNLGYNVGYYNLLCKNKYLAKDIYLDRSFNCGIIGGKDCSFFYEYADTAIKMVEDIQNKNLWLRSYPEFATWTKAVLAEQYYLGCALKKYNINPELFFNNSPQNYEPQSDIAKKFFEETGAVHLLGPSKRENVLIIDKILGFNKQDIIDYVI